MVRLCWGYLPQASTLLCLFTTILGYTGHLTGSNFVVADRFDCVMKMRLCFCSTAILYIVPPRRRRGGGGGGGGGGVHVEDGQGAYLTMDHNLVCLVCLSSILSMLLRPAGLQLYLFSPMPDGKHFRCLLAMHVGLMARSAEAVCLARYSGLAYVKDTETRQCTLTYGPCAHSYSTPSAMCTPDSFFRKFPASQ